MNCCLNERHAHWNQTAFKWIENHTDALQGSRAQQRFVVFFAKDHRRGAAFALQFKIRVSNSPPDAGPVSEADRCELFVAYVLTMVLTFQERGVNAS